MKIKTEITYTSGDCYFLRKDGWLFLKNAAINYIGEWGTWFYKGDEQEAQKLLDERMEAIVKKSKDYYSRQWV